MRQHRQDRTADGEPEAVEGAGAVREQGLGHRLERAREHHRPSYVRRRRLRGLGEALDRDGVQRALPHLAADQPEQEPLLVLRGRAHQLTDQPSPLGLRSGARDLAERAQPVVRPAYGQVGSAAGATGRPSTFQPTPSRPWGSRPAR
ncbi:hypothetical protein SALBM311S_00164 [Streptomyces alboniger]